MDKELAQLQKEVIKRLIEYEDELQALGDINRFKKTKRVSSSVAINIAAFPDLVQSLLDSGVETKEIAKQLRNFQERLLNDTVVIKGTETGHHKNMLRAGGSFYRADPKIWQNSVTRLADFFGTQFGDVPENIKSYLNWAHKSDTNTKGIEAALLGKIANPNKQLTAHPFGTVPQAIIKDLSPEELSDPDKFFDAMAKRIDMQLEAAKVADETQRPLVKAIQENIDPRAYRAPDIPTNLEIQKKVLLPENRQIIEQGILEVVQESGSVRVRRRQMAALATAGVGALSIAGTGASAAETYGRTQIAKETGNPLDYVQAGISGLSLAADVIPHPAAEFVSTPADLTNVAIDVARDPEPIINTFNKIKEDPLNELEYAGKQILGGLKTVGGAILFGY
jgi:hypothetical protein